MRQGERDAPLWFSSEISFLTSKTGSIVLPFRPLERCLNVDSIWAAPTVYDPHHHGRNAGCPTLSPTVAEGWEQTRPARRVTAFGLSSYRALHSFLSGSDFLAGCSTHSRCLR